MPETPPNSGGQSGGAPPANDPAAAGGPPAPGGGNTGATGQFTQEQVNSLLAEERRKTAERFSDYDAIKQKVADLEGASQSELEKVQAKLEETAAHDAASTARANALLVSNVVTTAAVKAGAVDPEVVVALLSGKVTVGSDGNVVENVDELVTKLMEDRPFLKSANGTTPAGGRGSADGGAHGAKPPGQAAATTGSAMNDMLRANR